VDNYNINSKNLKDNDKIKYNNHNYNLNKNHYNNSNDIEYEDFDEKIIESSKGEKNRSINFVNKCFDFNNDYDKDKDNEIGDNYESNDIADEYVI
jgi:hypothetical protein